MLKCFLLLPLLISFFSCSNGSPTPAGISEITPDTTQDTTAIKPTPEASFHDFLKNFIAVKLPFDVYSKINDPDRTGGVDSSFNKFMKDEFAVPYVMLDDTSRFYSLITLLPGDNFVPVLTTYDKLGNIIDSKVISTPGFGWSPCEKYYGYSCRIDRSFSISSSDSLIYVDCDDSGNHEVAGTDSLRCIFMNGKVTADGKIELDPERRTVQKVPPFKKAAVENK